MSIKRYAQIATGEIVEVIRNVPGPHYVLYADHVAALERGPGWRSMEDAPKDDLILAFTSKGDYVAVAWQEPTGEDAWGAWLDVDSNEHTPTAWMPLPPPPTDEVKL